LLDQFIIYLDEVVTNFKKTDYVHFTTKKNMSVTLKIGFNNNFISNNSYTKLLGINMNNILSWNKHIDLLVKKLSKACYMIQHIKTYMSAFSLKMIYHAIFHAVMSCGIMFWETRHRAI
jgi:hypothetical protein